MADAINPSHYKQGKVECIDALESATVNKTGLEAVCAANIIKYLWRYEAKNGLEDIRKAQWYLAKLIDYLEHKEEIDKMIAESDAEEEPDTDYLPVAVAHVKCSSSR
nr:MAG TPA: nucelotide kinase [Caudoviricetes sp.]